MCQMLLKGKAEYFSKAKEYCMLEFHLPEEFKGLSRPRLFNTHLTPKCLPKQVFEKRCKLIIVERNPKDVLTSRYHHMKNAAISKGEASVEWPDFLKFALENGKKNGLISVVSLLLCII